MAEIVVDRALSLMQPWATLMALGMKSIETRSWSMSYRGWIAIHASKRFPQASQWRCACEPFREALGGRTARDLPRGQIIAVAEFLGCRLVDYVPVTNLERAFGDYTPGRYAILTRGVRPVKQPLVINGALRLWRLPSPLLEGRDF